MPPKRIGRRPDPFDAAEVQRLLNQDLSQGDICKRLGMSYETLRKKCKANGILINRRERVYAKLDALKVPYFYEVWEESVKELVDSTGVHTKMFLEYLRDRNVRVRSAWEQRRISEKREREYQEWRASVSDVYLYVNGEKIAM